MLSIIRNFTITSTTTAALLVLLCGCASPETSKNSRFIGFKEAIILDEKTLFTASNLTEYSRAFAEAATHSDAGYRNWFWTTVYIPSEGTVIVRREFPSGSLATNFGKSTEILFGIQPCSSIDIRDRMISCMDAIPLPVMTVRAPLTVKSGNSAIARFPNGMQWTYEVLDQAQPY